MTTIPTPARLLPLLIALGVAQGAAAAPAGDFNAMVHRKVDAGGSFFTADEQRTVEAKCGYPAGSFTGKHWHMHDGILYCDNGRTVDDPEMRAISHRVGERASARVKAVMASPEVKAAMDRLVSGEVAAAMARAHAQLAAAFPAERSDR